MCNRRFIYILLIAVSFVFNSQSGKCREIIVQPGPGDGTDVWVTSVYFGGGQNDYKLRVGGWADWYYSLIKFDLSGLPTNADNAKIVLYSFYDGHTNRPPMHLDRVTSTWDENTKWNNRPTFTNIGSLPAPTLNSFYEIDITDLYNEWKANTFENDGIQLRPTFNSDAMNAFYSSDFLDNPALRPQLVITVNDTFIEINSPSGGEVWQVGEQYDISWDSFGITDVRIEYSIDNGATWQVIPATFPASSGSYTWTIPNEPSGECLVKISDAADLSVFDISDNVFTITLDALSEGLVAYYPFNGNAYDESGNSNNGTVYGAILTTDRYGNPNSAYEFDGNEDYIDVQDSESLRPSYMSISAWVFPKAANQMIIIGKSNYFTAEDEQYALNIEGNPGFHIKRNSGCNPGQGWNSVNNTSPILTNQWSHIVGTYEGDTLKIFVNGELKNINYDLPSGAIDDCPGGNFRIGLWWEGDKNYFYGSIDDIRIYNRAISNAEIELLFNEASGPSISLLSPNGGERWDVGSTYDITWNSSGVNEVRIEYSIDGGINWLLIPATIPAAGGSFPWLIPDEPSTKCVVRISDAADTTITDVSTGQFEIVPNVTTIITHGWTPDFIEPEWKDYKWVFCMADAISADRQICFIWQGTVYQTDLDYQGFADNFDDEEDINDIVLNSGHFTSNLNLNKDKDVVFVFDWVEESASNEHGYLEAAADVLAAALLDLSRDNPWLLDETHFIGHSRGAILNSEAIQRLLYYVGENALPPSVKLDKDIHMTTLDPHPAGHWQGAPQRDDDVNSDNIVDNNGDHIGITGWKSHNSPHKVAYIDNFFQTNGLFIGLSDYPGLVFVNQEPELTERLEDFNPFTLNHSLVHTWYYGTINVNATHDEFGDEEIDPDNDWYPNGRGVQGFYHSIERGGNLIESDDIELYPVTSDKNYGEKYLIFNGSLKHPVSYSNNAVIDAPGWEFQGGGGNGIIGNGPEIIKTYSVKRYLLNTHLELDANHTSKTHNYFYIPGNKTKIYYRLQVNNNPQSPNIFRVKVGDNIDRTVINQAKNYTWKSVDVSNLQGSSQTLTFELFGTINTNVWIDKIGFTQQFDITSTLGYTDLNLKNASANITSQILFGAYDVDGNYTGLVNDSIWVTEIPGSEFVLSTIDSLNVITATVILPPAPANLPYRYDIKSIGASENLTLTMEDATDEEDAKYVVFDNVAITPTTSATVILENVTDTTSLLLDFDGDGVFEDTLYSDLYLENFRITQEIQGSGSIISMDTSLVNLDTIIVNYGDTVGFAIIPDSGYQIVEVFVDDNSIGAASNFTFENIKSDHSINAIFSPITGIGENQNSFLPTEFTVEQNYPNPFNPTTQIRYGLPKTEKVELVVFNALGQKVKTLIFGFQEAGYHTVTWDGTNEAGQSVSSGIYFYQIQAGHPSTGSGQRFVQVRKMLLVR